MSEEGWREGSWMHTFTGKRFYPLDPRVEDIDIRDIAHSLSLQCRYNGHVQRFYSVAEHCVLMADWVYDQDSAQNALWALLHDATEAYVGDMIRPLKKYMPDFIATEDRVMAVIAEKFGLYTTEMPDIVKEADNRILLTERDALMVPTAFAWEQDGLDPLPVTVNVWSSDEAEAQYIAAFSYFYGEVICAGDDEYV